MPEMAGYKGLTRLEVIRKLNAQREWVNQGLYKLLLDKDMSVLAYERMKSKPGNMTPGTDGDTLDGFSTAQIEKLIVTMRDESYQCKPVRTTYIPKSNGKLRKLGIPSTRDKLVQEVVMLILEAVYDSPEGPYFLENSHGFRSSKSCHSALREIQRKWSGVSWFLEGDIASCFDDIDHEILVKLIERKVSDQRFINLIWKILKAGYMDLDGTRRDSLAGTPQGGIASPILANIYLPVKRKDKLIKIVFYRNTDWTIKRDAFTDEPEVDRVRMNVRLRTRSKPGYPCCICGETEGIEMHHVRHVRKMDGSKSQGFTRVMGIMNRKQVPVCSACHKKIHRGEYDGLRLKDQAYDPRKPL
jgi:retron-type reverse transcriptase